MVKNTCQQSLCSSSFKLSTTACKAGAWDCLNYPQKFLSVLPLAASDIIIASLSKLNLVNSSCLPFSSSTRLVCFLSINCKCLISLITTSGVACKEVCSWLYHDLAVANQEVQCFGSWCALIPRSELHFTTYILKRDCQEFTKESEPVTVNGIIAVTDVVKDGCGYTLRRDRVMEGNTMPGYFSVITNFTTQSFK